MDKKFIIGFSVLGILITMYFFNVQSQKNYLSKSNPFIIINKEDIKKIIISSKEDAIELSLKDTTWSISGNDTLIMKINAINNFLDKLYALEKEHIVTSKEEKWNIYGVDPASGTHLAFVGEGGTTLAYFVFGKANNTEYNRCYVKADKNNEVYLLNSNIMYQLQTTAAFWGEVPKKEIVIPDSSLIDSSAISF